MSAVALVVSIIALGLAGVAYWRAGGERDVARLDAGLRRELGDLRAKQIELVDHANQSLSAAYDSSRVRLRSARGRIHRLQEGTVEGLEAQLRRAAEHLEALTTRVERAAGAARASTVAAARATERTIARRTRRLQARVVVLEVKASTRLAQRAAAAGEFDRADARLTDAADRLTEARSILVDDDAFDDELDAIKDDLRHAVSAVRARAQDTRQRIEQVLADTDRVVTSLEAEEGEAANQEPAGTTVDAR